MNIVEGFTMGVTALKAVLALMKDAKDLLPNGPQKASAEEKIGEAEKALRIAEAQTAQSLGYELCKCAFPPCPMLSIGPSQEEGMEGVEVFQCPNCRKLSPTNETVAAMKQQNEKARAMAKSYSVR